eukprot:TRINITY_DN461_c2_g1_i9.p1 TRINITY_DN461_c2_g1~~TRINITY_DN461_c2_g1_i9.p1  ORF type:complete len:347 (-),score=19.57 TRINITY_DN461_c2_g1_i9:439-1479(-)
MVSFFQELTTCAPQTQTMVQEFNHQSNNLNNSDYNVVNQHQDNTQATIQIQQKNGNISNNQQSQDGIIELHSEERKNENLTWENEDQNIWSAAAYGKLEFILNAQLRGEKMDAPDYFGNTPLHYSITYGNYVISQFLLQEIGMNPNIIGSGGNTPLHFAAMHNRVASVQLLLNMGATPQIINSENKTPYQIAQEERDIDLLYLFDKWSKKPYKNIDQVSEIGINPNEIQLMKQEIQHLRQQQDKRNWQTMKFNHSLQQAINQQGIVVQDLVNSYMSLQSVIQQQFLPTLQPQLTCNPSVQQQQQQNSNQVHQIERSKYSQVGAHKNSYMGDYCQPHAHSTMQTRCN